MDEAKEIIKDWKLLVLLVFSVGNFVVWLQAVTGHLILTLVTSSHQLDVRTCSSKNHLLGWVNIMLKVKITSPSSFGI